MFNPATEQIMKKRIFYIISFLVIFCIEVLIALYVRDRFIRPYVGDMLVVVLVYSFVRIFLPTGIPRIRLSLVGSEMCIRDRLCCGMRFHCLIRAFRPA